MSGQGARARSDGDLSALPGRSFYHDLLDDLNDGIYFLDAERRITYWSPGAERLTGYTADEVLGRRCSDNILVHTDCDGRVLCGRDTCPAVAAVESGERSEKRIFLRHKDGHRVPVLTRIRPIVNRGGAIVGAAEVFNVLTDSFAMEEQMEELRRTALIDPLTGVGNRRLGERHLQERLGEAERYGWRVGVLFIDLDGFKQINDLCGHDVGDRLLKMVAQTLSHNVRAFDSVSRWGGEEFLVLLRNLAPENLLGAANQLRALVASAGTTAGSFDLRVTVSIGATMVQAGDSAETLVRRVDQLMYRSKKKGGDCVTTDETPQVEAGASERSACHRRRSLGLFRGSR